VKDELELLRLFRDEIPGPSTDAWARARAAIAVARSEEEPPRRRRKRGLRQLRLLPMAFAGTVAVTVVCLLAVLLPSATEGHRPAPSTQDVQANLERALTLAVQDNEVEYARTVYPPGSTLEPVPAGLRVRYGPKTDSAWSIRSVVDWSYRGTSKVSAFDATGQPVFDETITLPSGHAGTTLAVIYREASWWRATVKAPAVVRQTYRCGSGISVGSGSWTAFISYELSCGEYTTDARQWLDGIYTIKITGGNGLDVLWVNPATYLPVRAVFTLGRERIQTNYRWQSPSLTNLAMLRESVPAGFRQVSPPS
jgi:hypothetical protein